MTESSVSDTAIATPVAAKTKKATTAKAKSASKKAAPSHPPTAQMVNNAIKSLKERGGSSLQAIKKYISSTYKVDADKIAPFIKKYLISAVNNGSLIRAKGKGAAGSFKLAVAGKTESGKKPAMKTPKATDTKKIAKPKKAAATSKKEKPKVTKAVKPPVAKKSPTKEAAKKPKSPKKAAPKKATTKKAAPKK